MTTWEFPSSEPVTISICDWASGSIAISGEQADAVAVKIVGSRTGANVDDEISLVKVGFQDGKLAIVGPKASGGFRRHKSLDLTIIAPAGSDCQARTASGDVACVGELGKLDLQTASGDVTVTSASGQVDARTASGDVFVDKAAADVHVNTASGDVQVGRAGGEVEVRSASGDVAVSTGGPVAIRTSAGDIQVKELSNGNADLHSLSGDIRVTVSPGVGVYLDLATTAGDVRNELDETDEPGSGAEGQAPIEIRCRSLSGDIRIAKGVGTASRSATQ